VVLCSRRRQAPPPGKKKQPAKLSQVPKRKPFQSKDTKPAKPPSKFVPFGARDSRAIETAFQKLSEEEELAESTRYKRASAIELFQDWDPTKLDKAPEKEVKVLVNEDYLFDVDIKRRELAPVYWEGPVYDVRRGTWFFQGKRSLQKGPAATQNSRCKQANWGRSRG
jgi:hypothetical protein